MSGREKHPICIHYTYNSEDNGSMKNVCNMHSYFKKHNIKLKTHADYKYVKVIDVCGHKAEESVGNENSKFAT